MSPIRRGIHSDAARAILELRALQLEITKPQDLTPVLVRMLKLRLDTAQRALEHAASGIKSLEDLT